ncbi:MAG: hypothetical protein RBR97_15335 [Bacteroidales bacterium]|nr:hypothetical protein [Bacteroidales bacterium]
MTKTLLFLIISLITTTLLLGQNYRTVQFVDIVHNKPIYGVMVFTDGNFASVSDDNGNCQIDSNINEIYCKYLGYKDTLINIKECNKCVISLVTNFNLLDEVEINAKYNPKKHLLKLLAESQKSSYDIDTVIYYKFKETNIIPAIGQTEIFSGTLKVENKGYSKKANLIYLSEVSKYNNTIEENYYELIGSSRLFEKFINDILYPENIAKLKKHLIVEKSDLYTPDSISFLLFNKNEQITTNCNYISFINNKIRTREVAISRLRNNKYIKYYLKTTYSTIPISIPEKIVATYEYYISDNTLIINQIEIEKIDNPKTEIDLNILIYDSCKKIIENVKLKFPEIVIDKESLTEE